MNSRAFLKYYSDINLYNLPVSFIFGAISGPVYGFIIFCSFGILIGLLGFRHFKKSEYYIYYNLGWRKKKLIKNVWLVNVVISIALFLFILLIN